MVRLLLRWIALAISVVAASFITAGLGFQTEAKTPAGIVQLFIGVALLAFLNVTLGKILKFLAMPLNCMTLGLFSIVINAAVLWFAATFELGFKITKPGFEGFVAALAASVLISLINGMLGVFLPEKDKD